MMRVTLPLLAVSILGVSMLCEPASAGRRPYLFTYDTEALAQGDFELEQWLWSKYNPPAPKTTIDLTAGLLERSRNRSRSSA